MARWFTIGMESAPQTSEGPFFYFEGNYTIGSNATVTRDTSIKRTGASSRAHNSGPSGALAYTTLAWGLQGNNGYYLRTYIRLSALPSSQITVAVLSTNTGHLVSARITSAGKVQLWNETGTPAKIGSDSAASISAGNWYRLELFCKVLSGASDDSCELRLDGTSVASASSLSLSTSMVTQAFLGIVGFQDASQIVYIDDVAVNDDTGAAQNTWPGAGQVLYLNPVSDNARTGSWTAGGGATTSLYDAVNNEPPAGLATANNLSQILDANTADTTGNYDANLQSYSDAGIVSGSTIALVQSVFQVATSNTVSVSGAIRVVSNPAQGAEESKTIGTGAARGTWPANWHSLWGAAQTSPSVTLATQPVLRIGRRGSQATELHCCGMRLAVEYTPGGGGGGGGTGANMMLLGVG